MDENSPTKLDAKILIKVTRETDPVTGTLSRVSLKGAVLLEASSTEPEMLADPRMVVVRALRGAADEIEREGVEHMDTTAPSLTKPPLGIWSGGHGEA